MAFKQAAVIVGLSAALAVGAGVPGLTAQAMRNVPRISVDELSALLDKKAVVVIDVRDPGQFKEGRIPGSVNIDYTEMPGKARQFKGETKTIVTYCACVGDTTAARAALDLAAAGVPGAKALQGGWSEWIARGSPVEK